MEFDNREILFEKFCKPISEKLDSQKQLLINDNKLTIGQKYVKGIFQGAEYLGMKYKDIKSIEDKLSDSPCDFGSVKRELYQLRKLKDKICGSGFALCYK
ncbi:hypothetical protein [Ruminococcus sp.]|uniref:hypothetical protein n=1 Tax=Ruminococcus sp. TaxID=41978 RepID=UPI0025CE335B|nr:hypothetical protein [Ruminococcus sp.]MBQ8966252.1 hypothetical protein [Ruminococcus sp.]